MQCTGSLTSLVNCTHNGWGSIAFRCNDHTVDAGVVCTNSSGDTGYQVRIQGGSSPNEGRIEVNYWGTWGAICDNGFGLNEANVVCRMLGYRSAITSKSLAKSSHTAWLKDLSCQGSEQTIENCTKSSFGTQTCPNNNIAGVVCLPNNTRPETAKMFLGLQNRVIIGFEGFNRSMCYDGFDEKDARVICRMKGYHDVDKITYVNNQTLGVNERQVWILNVTCQGDEKYLNQCSINWNWKNKACPSTYFAAVSCKKSPFGIRLVDGPSNSNNSGRLEIRVNGEWGTVCDESWDVNASEVACRMLGFQKVVRIKKFQQGQTSQRVWIQNISCVGCERSLNDCYHPAWGSSCSHSRDVGLVCLPNVPARPSVNIMSDGRIELSYYGVNRSICYDGFDLNDATVICRMKGYEDAAYITNIASQAGDPKTNEVWLLKMTCEGSEKSFKSCNPAWNWENAPCPNGSPARAGVVCIQKDSPLAVEFRLRDVKTPYSGRLTVNYYRQWGNICAKDLKLEDAHVICRMLNFTGALTISHWGKHSGNVSFELVKHCNGTENNMSQCQHVKLKQVKTCAENNYAGVVCIPKIQATPTPLPDNVRLQGGSSSLDGRVEVERHKVWGTVCNSGWDMHEANVVCHMLGFDGAVTAYKTFGEGKGPIWMSGLQCNGNEGNIEDCASDAQQKTTSCDHSMDAGVVCRRYKDTVTVELENGTSSYIGRIKLLRNSTEGSICGNGWDKKDADVICQMKGAEKALAPISHFGGGLQNIWLSDVSCTGKEKSLDMCNSSGWANNSCSANHHAGVICKQPGNQVNDPNVNLRMILDTKTNLSRVEVQYYGVWGTISSNNWDLADAHVVCFRNGKGKATTVGNQINEDKLPVWIDNLNCRGSENKIEDCDFEWGVSSGDLSRVATVGCTTEVDKSPMVAAIKPGSGRAGFGQVEITYKTKKYAVCGDKWDKKDADVICKMSGFAAGSLAAITKYGVNANNLWLSGFECRGTESGISECFRAVTSNCPGNVSAGVMCKTSNAADPKIKLSLNGGSKGRVEVSYNDARGAVCNNGNSQENARVICRMLGYVDVSSYGATSNTDGQLIWLSNMKCKGTENSIKDCSPKWGEGTCNDDNVLSVTCKAAEAPHFQILGSNDITDSTAKIGFQNFGPISSLNAIFQIAVEKRPYEERYQSFNTQEKPFQFHLVNYTTSVLAHHPSYITAEVRAEHLSKHKNFTIGDPNLNQGKVVPNDGFENEPLQAECPYRVYVRVATESYESTRIYGDYSYVAFKTKRVYAKGRADKLLPSSRGGGAVIGMSIVIIMLIAVIICASVWFIRKQRNEEMDASDKTQGLEMTNGDMRTVNDIPEGYYQAPLREERNEYVTSPEKDKAAYQSLVTRTRIARNKQENESPLYVEIRS